MKGVGDGVAVKSGVIIAVGGTGVRLGVVVT
jgi:hypothetical protein